MYCFIAVKHRRRAVKVILHSGSVADYERRVIISAAITKVLVFIKRATVELSALPQRAAVETQLHH